MKRKSSDAGVRSEVPEDDGKTWWQSQCRYCRLCLPLVISERAQGRFFLIPPRPTKESLVPSALTDQGAERG